MSPATRSAASCLTSARTTCAPCCAKIRAICSPMPDPAPVTKPIFLSKRNTCDSFLLHYAHYSDLPGCLSLDCLPFVDKKFCNYVGLPSACLLTARTHTLPAGAAAGGEKSRIVTKYFLSLVCMEHFLHHGPPLTGSPRLQRCLHRIGPGPPLTRLGVRGHLRHIGLIIVAGIFKIGKEQLAVAKNAVITNVASVHRRQHPRADRAMQAS